MVTKDSFKKILLTSHLSFIETTVMRGNSGQPRASPFLRIEAGNTMVIESCRDWSGSRELSEDLIAEIILAHPLKVRAITIEGTADVETLFQS